MCIGSSRIDCDFEEDFCEYTQAQDDDFDWTRHRGNTPSDDTGPSVDYTTATGLWTGDIM